jgi:small subunit ribosomal protein S16
MSVVIRLMRAGAKKRPFYRVVAADSRRQRDGRFLEILGHYHPLSRPYELKLHKDKVEKWLSRGAQPSEQAASLLRSLGISGAPAVVAVVEGEAAPRPAVKKKAAGARPVRRVPRKPSERKVRAKATRATKKKKAAKA